jgi:hypothetical protein
MPFLGRFLASAPELHKTNYNRYNQKVYLIFQLVPLAMDLESHSVKLSLSIGLLSWLRSTVGVSIEITP